MTEPWKYPSKTDAELETLAWDIMAGKVFGTWDLRDANPGSLAMTFMIVAFMEQEHREALKANDIVHLYEYMDKAGPRSVNGMPSFMSACYLDKADARKLFTRCKDISELKEQRMKETN